MDTIQDALAVKDLLLTAIKVGSYSVCTAAAVTGLERFMGSMDTEARIRVILTQWRGVLDRLTGEQEAQMEAVRPGVVSHMIHTLKDLEQRLCFHGIESRHASLWERLNRRPSKSVSKLWECVKNADEDFRSSTEHILRFADRALPALESTGTASELTAPGSHDASAASVWGADRCAPTPAQGCERHPEGPMMIEEPVTMNAGRFPSRDLPELRYACADDSPV